MLMFITWRKRKRFYNGKTGLADYANNADLKEDEMKFAENTFGE